MGTGTLALLAFLPIIVVMILMPGLGWPAKKAMPLSYLTVVLLAYFVWKVDTVRIAAATVQGIWTAVGLLWIVFGAMVLLATLMNSGAVATIRHGFSKVTPDRRIQAIILGFLFGCFIEGSSGFGTPAAVVGPLLLAMGFPAMAAVVVGMVTQSMPVSFGAVGTPILTGVQTGLKSSEGIVEKAAAAMNMVNLDSTGAVKDFLPYVYSIAARIGILHACVGFLMPLIICCLITGIFGKNKDWKEGLEVAPFAIFTGITFAIPYVFLALYTTPEFPSMVGALIALPIVCIAASNGFLTPKNTWDFAPKSEWPAMWSGSFEGDPGELRPGMSVIKAWTPYVLVGLSLIISRLPVLPVAAYMKKFDFGLYSIFGTNISQSWQWVHSPGTIILLVSLVTFFIHQMKVEEYIGAWKESGANIASTAMALLFSVPMVRVFIESGVNGSGYMSMPLTLASGVADSVGGMWPFFAPWIGALGAFVAGSNTISNMMFSLFQWKVADLIGVSQRIVVALQAVGGAGGNMFCVHNVVAAAAVVGMIGQEGFILRLTALPTVYYCTAAGIYGCIAIYVLKLV